MAWAARWIWLIGLVVGLGLSGMVRAKALTQKSFTVMTFNVENLFDTEPDAGKEDHTFLPLSQKGGAEHKKRCAEAGSRFRQEECAALDWSEAVLQRKLANVGAVIRSAAAGQGADLVFLAEVENLKVLERLRREHLKEAGYRPAILIEGPDSRGIDVAMLSRFPLDGTPILHKIPFKMEDGRESRGILEARFKTQDGTRITAFAVHFPSPSHPRALREQALDFLNDLGAKAAKTADVVLAGGDFNIKAEDESRLFRGIASYRWMVSHHEGCHQCIGTIYFQPFQGSQGRGKKNAGPPREEDSWSFFDAIMIYRQTERNKAPQWQFDRSSIAVLNQLPIQKNADGTPARFDPKGGERGVADHFPVFSRIVLEK